MARNGDRYGHGPGVERRAVHGPRCGPGSCRGDRLRSSRRAADAARDRRGRSRESRGEAGAGGAEPVSETAGAQWEVRGRVEPGG